MKRQIHDRLFCLAVLSFMPLAVDFASAGEPLSWKLKPGQQFDVEIIQTMKQFSKILGNDGVMRQTTKICMSWVVDQVDGEGNSHLTQIIERISVNIQAPQGELIYDSNAKEEPAGMARVLADTMSPMVGAKIVQTMNKRGQILDVTVPDEALSGLRQNPLTKQLISDSFMKDSFATASPEFPAEALVKGQYWQSSTEMRSPVGPMKLNNTYTYRGSEHRNGHQLERIGIKVEMELDEKPNALGVKIDLKDQENDGEILFDNQLGHLIESTMVQKMTMTINAFGQTVDHERKTLNTSRFVQPRQKRGTQQKPNLEWPRATP